MIYLDSFILPSIRTEDALVKTAIDEWQRGHCDNRYPCEIFPDKGLSRIDFSTVTIFYGGNGSGKSTLLNLITQKLKLKRLAPFNSSVIFDRYLESCDFNMGYDDEGDEFKVPHKSRIITSDDVFDYMLSVRTNNKSLEDNIELARKEHNELAFAPTVRMNSMADYDDLHQQLEARRISARRFSQKKVGEELRLKSNGETALQFFDERLENDALYLLDEPENSMSPKLQKELVKNLENMAKYCGDQFIIATHSPFVLAMKNAKIYDLDSCPVRVCNWWELENVKIYFDFFEQNKELFKKEV